MYCILGSFLVYPNKQRRKSNIRIYSVFCSRIHTQSNLFILTSLTSLHLQIFNYLHKIQFFLLLLPAPVCDEISVYKLSKSCQHNILCLILFISLTIENSYYKAIIESCLESMIESLKQKERMVYSNSIFY